VVVGVCGWLLVFMGGCVNEQEQGVCDAAEN